MQILTMHSSDLGPGTEKNSAGTWAKFKPTECSLQRDSPTTKKQCGQMNSGRKLPCILLFIVDLSPFWCKLSETDFVLVPCLLYPWNFWQCQEQCKPSTLMRWANECNKTFFFNYSFHKALWNHLWLSFNDILSQFYIFPVTCNN